MCLRSGWLRSLNLRWRYFFSLFFFLTSVEWVELNAFPYPGNDHTLPSLLPTLSRSWIIHEYTYRRSCYWHTSIIIYLDVNIIYYCCSSVTMIQSTPRVGVATSHWNWSIWEGNSSWDSWQEVCMPVHSNWMHTGIWVS